MYLVTKALKTFIHITCRLDEQQQFKVWISAILPHLVTWQRLVYTRFFKYESKTNLDASVCASQEEMSIYPA